VDDQELCLPQIGDDCRIFRPVGELGVADVKDVDAVGAAGDRPASRCRRRIAGRTEDHPMEGQRDGRPQAPLV